VKGVGEKQCWRKTMVVKTVVVDRRRLPKEI